MNERPSILWLNISLDACECIGRTQKEVSNERTHKTSRGNLS